MSGSVDLDHTYAAATTRGFGDTNSKCIMDNNAHVDSDHLCPHCERLELHLHNQREDKSYILPTKHEILANSFCPVCRLLRSSIGFAIADDGPVMYATWTRHGGFRIPMSCTLIFLNDSNSARSPRGMGRTVHNTFSPELARKWLRICERDHGEGCTHAPNVAASSEFPAGIKVLRMIDLHSQSIVEVGPECRYVALSYMWGQVEAVKLLRENKEQLMSPGGLLAFRYRLPHTINDSIDLLCATGEQYLWVDSLCLLQDDYTEMRDTIGKMDHIYGGSVFTILAGAGGDAHAGLPGLRSGSRVEKAGQYTEEVHPDLRMAVIKPLDDFLNLSNHITRGWTMQEHVLSHRLLIFTGTLVFFKCHKNCWSEDTIYDDFPDEISEPLLVRSASINIPLIGDSKTDTNPFSTYTSVIMTYSSRALTKESDTLDAVSGILNVMKLRLKSEMLAGLPTRFFDLAILFFYPWYGPRSGARRTGFPSWSWAGWRTSSTMMMNARPSPHAEIEEWSTTQTYIVWHKRDPETRELSLVWDAHQDVRAQETNVMLNSPSLQVVSSLPFGRAESTRFIGLNTKPLSDFNSDGITHTYPLLQFWAYTVEIYALEPPPPEAQTYGSQDRTDRIIGFNGALCGGILADDLDLLDDAGGRCECILLSKAEGHNNEFNDTFFWPSASKPIWWVIFITWDGVVAERRGVGFIYRDCMEYLTPRQWKEILLA